MKLHGQGDLEREGFIWGLQLQRDKFMPTTVGKCSIGLELEAEGELG